MSSVLIVRRHPPVGDRSWPEVVAAVSDVEVDVMVGRPISNDRASAAPAALAARLERAERKKRRRRLASDTAASTPPRCSDRRAESTPEGPRQ